MAMNQKQRDHFIDRVKEKCSGKISQLKALHAAQIQATSEMKYHEFVSALDLHEDMEALNTAETIWKQEVDKIRGTLAGLKDIHPDGKETFYLSCSDAYSTFKKYLSECCRATAEREFYNTEAGQELKALEETQRHAIDTIMMDGSKVQDLTLKLNGILGKSNLQLTIGEGVQA